jgi:hypothetical protein
MALAGGKAERESVRPAGVVPSGMRFGVLVDCQTASAIGMGCVAQSRSLSLGTIRIVPPAVILSTPVSYVDSLALSIAELSVALTSI